MKIGFTYDCFEDYIEQGFDANDCAEFDYRKTIDSIVETLQSLNHEVIKIGNVKELIKCIYKGDRWDIVFNIAEGIKGGARESQVPTILELYDIPYVFSDPVIMSILMNKALAKRVVRDFGIRTANFVVVDDINLLANVSKELKFPLFIKPNFEGNSKGIGVQSIVYSEKELFDVCEDLLCIHKQSIIIEEYLPGREFTVGIIGTGNDSKVLGVLEIKLRQQEVDVCYSRTVKADCHNKVDYVLVSDKEAMLAADYALKIWKLLGCRDAGRIDFRSNQQKIPNFLEVNPLAGLEKNDSDLPILGKKVGIEYPELIKMILNSAFARYPTLSRKCSYLPNNKQEKTEIGL